MLVIENIKVIGFDLDQTLYPKSPEIDEEIQKYIYQQIAEKRSCSIEEAKRLFKSYYPRLTGSKALVELGFELERARNIVQEALESADIVRFLKPNPKIIKLLEELKEKYSLSLITSSPKKTAMDKLNKLNISIELFDFISCGEFPKSDGIAYKNWFEYFKKKDPFLKPENFLYVGDRKSSDVDIPLSLGMKAVLVNVDKKDLKIDVPQFNSILEIRKILL